MISKPFVILLAAVMAPLCSAQTGSLLPTKIKTQPTAVVQDFGSSTGSIASGQAIGDFQGSFGPSHVSGMTAQQLSQYSGTHSAPAVGPHTNPVPEPATIAALSFGLLPLLRRRKKA